MLTQLGLFGNEGATKERKVQKPERYGVCVECGGQTVKPAGTGGRVSTWCDACREKDRQCVICGSAFKPLIVRQMCCCLACSRIATGNATKERYAVCNVHTCQHCGKEYKAKKSDRDTYCSRECSYTARALATAHRRQAVAHRVRTCECKQCGVTFVPQQRREEYCSDACRVTRGRAVGNARAAAKKAATTKPRACKCCGREFLPLRGNKRRVFCGVRCMKKYAQRNGAKSLNSRGRQVLRSFYGEAWMDHYESINRQRVYERDGWKCGICGEAIDRQAKSPDDRSASVDHIVALSLGGDHTYANVRTAHFGCNWRRGTGAKTA